MSRQLLRSFRLLSVLVMFIVTAQLVVAQNAGGDKLTPPAPNAPTGAAQVSLDAKLASMQGLWRLTELHSLKANEARRSEVGYLLVSGLCFSLELHWGWTSQDGGTRFVSKDFQSGTHRFELDDAGYLEARSLIGSASLLQAARSPHTSFPRRRSAYD